MNEIFIQCPFCNSKTRVKIRYDTVLIKFPLYCLKCKQEYLIEVKTLHITIIKESDAQAQSR